MSDITRSTVVHLNPVYSKNLINNVPLQDVKISEESYRKNSRDGEGRLTNISRTMQAPQKIPIGTCATFLIFTCLTIQISDLPIPRPCFTSAAKPGRVVGPVIADENGRVVKEPYDPRTLIRGAILPPTYHYQKPIAGNQERSAAETKLDISLRATKQASQCGMASKLGSDIAISIDSNPFYMTRAGVNKVELKDQISIDTNFLQAKAAQYSGLGAATATTTSVAHRKVIAGQYSMTKMY